MSKQRTFQSQSLNDWLFYLESQHHKDIDLGLARVQKVAQIGQLTHFPTSKVVLVAGTNGKGTTIRFMEQYLLSKGHTVGVYSSPHLIKYNERVRLNGKDVCDDEHIRAFDFIESSRGKTSLTYFEFSTLSAFKIFQRHEPDYILVEVGLGGRLDATNIIEHDLAVVTSIGLDHIDWLGDDISVIAYEKAGIFRTGKPAVIGEPEQYEGFQRQIDAIQPSVVLKAEQDFNASTTSDGWSYHSTSLNLSNLSDSLVPRQNLLTAITALNLLGIELTSEQINLVLANLSLPGRMQLISRNPCQIVDVAHNSHAMQYLASRLFEEGGLANNNKIDVVIAMMKDKDISDALSVFKGKVNNWYLASLENNPRAANPEYIANSLQDIGESNIKLAGSVANSWKIASKDQQDRLLLGIGSFYTVADILTCSEV